MEKKKINLISSYTVKKTSRKFNTNIVFAAAAICLVLTTIITWVFLTMQTNNYIGKKDEIVESLENDNHKAGLKRAQALAERVATRTLMRDEIKGDSENLKGAPVLSWDNLDELFFLSGNTRGGTRLVILSYDSVKNELDINCRSTTRDDPYDFVMWLRSSIKEGRLNFSDVKYTGANESGGDYIFQVKLVSEGSK